MRPAACAGRLPAGARGEQPPTLLSVVEHRTRLSAEPRHVVGLCAAYVYRSRRFVIWLSWGWSPQFLFLSEFLWSRLWEMVFLLSWHSGPACTVIHMGFG